MPILFHNSLQRVSPSDGPMPMLAWKKSDNVGVLRPNITQLFNNYVPIPTLYVTPVANDRVCPSTMHTQVKPEDVEAL